MYPWLREKKYQAKLAKQSNNMMPYSLHAGLNRNSIFSVPVLQNKDIMYTGNGNPNSVAMQTPSGPIHKGELMFGGTGGGQVITDAVSSRELMTNPAIAGRLGYKCGGYKRQGYQTGGYINDGTQDILPVNQRPETQSIIPPGQVTTGIQAPNTNTQSQKTVSAPSSDILREKGLAGIENILKHGSVAGSVAGKKELSDLKSTQDVERQVLKQEQAQRGIKGHEAAGQLARLTAEHEGQLAETEAKIGIEKLGSQERAAQILAQEGKTQFDIELSKQVQGLNEAQFSEFIRQFDVGSDQWNKAFEERRREFNIGSDQWNKTFEEQRRQFDVGSDQWQQSFTEQRRQYDQNFEEQRRQFDVGSEQWNKSFDEQRRQYDQSFEEQKRQFNVGSEQWEKARQDQLDQWQKSFDEQRRQFDVGSEQWNQSFKLEREKFSAEDERWWASFDEQRRQFDVGSEQWTKSFEEQKRQFDVGSDQWNKTHDLQVKQFAQQVSMDKHTVDVWKDNIAFRDKAYLDKLSMDQQQLAMQQAVHEKEMKLYDYKIDATKNDVQSQQYWESSKKLYNYASTHLDAYNKETGNFTPDAEHELFQWYKAKYPGRFDNYNNVDHLRSYPQAYSEFKKWATTEWKAATDNRLTNPYDKMLYDVNSSSLDQASKDILKKVLTSPEALAQIAGIVYDPKTDTVQVKTTSGIQNIQQVELSNAMNKIMPNSGNNQGTNNKKETPGPVGPGPVGPVGPGPKGPEITIV